MNPKDKRHQDSQPLKDVIDHFLKAYSLEYKMKELDIVAAWPELMGGAIAFRTKSITIKNKTLYLEINSAVMRDELYHGKKVIIERINTFARTEVINDVWFS